MAANQIRLVCTGKSTHTRRIIGVLVDDRRPGQEYDVDATHRAMRLLADNAGRDHPERERAERFVQNARVVAGNVLVSPWRRRKTRAGNSELTIRDALVVTDTRDGGRLFTMTCRKCGLNLPKREEWITRICDTMADGEVDISYVR